MRRNPVPGVTPSHKLTAGTSNCATAEYRRRFGHPAYRRSPGTSVELHTADGRRLVPADEDLRLFDAAADAWRRLPDEVQQAGCALVSGLVYPISLSHADFLVAGPARGRERRPWPSESGGEATYAAIVDPVRRLRADPGFHRPEVGPGVGLATP